MLYNIATNVNWVDICIIVILIRIIYIGVNTGLPIELFKFFGTLSAIFISLHFYTRVGEFLQNIVGLREIPADVFNFIAFIILASLGYSVFLFLRKSVARFWKMDTVTELNKWGGVVLGSIRAFLLVGFLVFACAVSGNDYARLSIKESYSGRMAIKIAPAAYSAMWNSVGSKLLSGSINQAALDVKKGLTK